MLIFFTLFYKVAYYVSLSSTRVSHLQFGFLEGGTFNISISDQPDIRGLVVALANKAELKKLQKEFPDTEDVCFNNANISGLTHVFPGRPSGVVESYTGTIPSKDIYTVIYQICYTEPPYQFKVEFNFQNPNSKLDYRWNPVFKETPIFLALFGCELIIWLVNWVMHFKVKVGLHIMITLLICVSVIIVGIRYGMFKYSEKNDSDNKFAISLLIFKSFFTFCIATLFLLAVKGWCILVHKLKTCEIIRATLYSAFFVISYTVTDYIEAPFYVIGIILIIMIVAFILFLYELFKSLMKSKNIIISRLLAYSEQGIDLKTTPFYAKYRMFNAIYILLYIYIMFQLISFTILFLLDQNYWIEYLTTDISNLLIIAAFMYIYWIRGHNADGYLSVEDEGFEDFNIEDIQVSPVDLQEHMNKGGRQWQEGDTVPRNPIVTNSQEMEEINSPQKNKDDGDVSAPINQEA